MEAPKKIYLTQLMLFATPTISSNDNDIEYIRKDAFIERVTSYIQQHWIWNTNMIEDFRNYMKGE